MPAKTKAATKGKIVLKKIFFFMLLFYYNSSYFQSLKKTFCLYIKDEIIPTLIPIPKIRIKLTINDFFTSWMLFRKNKGAPKNKIEMRFMKKNK